MERFADYDPFARVYNQHWAHFARNILPALQQLVLKDLPAGASILDLCCGTGQLAQELTALGYTITGIDGSAEMLRYARRNAPAARFVLDDARTFKLPPIYHAVLSTFDSLNHIMTLQQLTDAFNNVHACLLPGGSFTFDLNTEHGYRTQWHGSFSIVEEDHVCAVRNSYNPVERVGQFDATIFTQEGPDWQRSDFSFNQKCYSADEVSQALSTVGFTGLRVYAYDRQQGLKELGLEATRAVFTCRKS